jgi:radical SAM superfamily enzyme YgiQ (UPF0313 family)
MAYIAATVENEGHEVHVIDAPAYGYDFKDIERAMRNFSPDVVGQQTVFSNIKECHQIARITKQIDPRIKVVLGGPHSTIYPESFINSEEVDFIVHGEGEIVMKALVDSIGNGADYSKVSGLIWKDGERVVKNNAESYIKDLDTLPLPARHLFPVGKYRASSHLQGSRVMSMVASRGCPFRCTFCWVPRSFGKKLRYRSPRHVIEEMRILKDQYGADSVRFWDDSFTASRKWINEFCDLLINDNINIRWFCLTRVNLVNAEILRKMKEAGCCQIFYGIESGVQRILNLIKKDITLDQAREAVKLTREAGIETTCAYMIGLPGETREDAEQTIKCAIELDSDFAQFNLTVPHMSGKEFYNDAIQYGTVLEDVDHATFCDNPVYIPHGRTKKELRETIKKAYRNFYMRPSYILRRLQKLYGLPLRKYFILALTGLKILFWR